MALFHGIVIYTRQYKEHDLLVRILTQEVGVRTFLARRAKRPRSPFGTTLQPFHTLVFTAKLPGQSTGLGFLDTVQDSCQPQTLVTDIVVNAYAAIIMNLADTALADRLTDVPQWYPVIYTALQKLDAGFDPQIITNIIEIQLLPLFGVAPNWHHDPISGATAGVFDYSEAFNGILAEAHFERDAYRLHANPAVVFHLRRLSAVQLADIQSITLNTTTKRGMQQVIDHIYERQVGFQPRAKRFLQQMGSWQTTLQRRPRKEQTTP